MKKGLFPKFLGELRQHAAPGYHVAGGLLDIAFATDWFADHSIHCPPSFLEFLRVVGVGRFFGGALIIFPLEDGSNTVEGTTSQLPDVDRAKYFAIGYDGTTEGCYCLDRSGEETAVFWHNFEAAQTAALHPDFVEWIEECPARLFDEQLYAGYGNVRDIAGVRRIIRERAAFEVRVLSAGTTKVRPPDHEKDFLPRYHHLVLGIRKLRDSCLPKLTVPVLRTGSSIGPKNVEYATIDLPDFPVGTEIARNVYVFDPFNLPFKKIEVLHVPEIDLSSQMRVKFEEIKGLF
jgi:hypothetical protein